MKQILTILTLTALSSSAIASGLTTPMLLEKGDVHVEAIVVYGEESDGNKSWKLLPSASYGLTDKLTIAPTGLRYHLFSNNAGLEVTTGMGLHGYYEDSNNDDVLGYGADLSGRYLLTQDTALTFGTAWTFWDEDNRDNRSELSTSIGIQKHLFDRVILSSSYTYHHLEDFVENSANSYTLGGNYILNKQTNLGLFISYNDFDPVKNGYSSDSSLEKMIGTYISYRF